MAKKKTLIFIKESQKMKKQKKLYSINHSDSLVNQPTSFYSQFSEFYLFARFTYKDYGKFKQPRYNASVQDQMLRR